LDTARAMSKPSHNLGEKLLEGEERAKEEWAHLDS